MTITVLNKNGCRVRTVDMPSEEIPYEGETMEIDGSTLRVTLVKWRLSHHPDAPEKPECIIDTVTPAPGTSW